MNLKDYFENQKGTGVLSTADGAGRVDSAIYARPHCMDDGTVAFIMPDKLTHANLQSNPHASFLFIEKGSRYKGARLTLTKTREETETDLLHDLRRKCYSPEQEALAGSKHLVFFKVDKQAPLIGVIEKDR